MRGSRSRTIKRQRGGHLHPLSPFPISGYETPIITQHLPPGTISYKGGSRRSKSRRRHRRTRHKSKSRSKRVANNGVWLNLARMAHPKGAVGGH
jgi:hypothetical protein